MKKLIAYLLSHLLFNIGDLISKTWGYKFNKVGIGHSVYQWCMDKSGKIQDWGGNKTPWRNVQ